MDVMIDEIRQAAGKEDEAHIRRAQHDPAAFKPLYEKYFKQIFLFVHHRIGDKAVSADVTSQVFLKALMNIPTYEFRGIPFSAWLYRIALNECNDLFRKQKRYRIVTIDDNALHELHEEITTDTTLAHLDKKLPDILQRLAPAELHLIELRYFEQRPFKEIADILGMTETAAKVKTYRILDKMKKFFLLER